MAFRARSFRRIAGRAGAEMSTDIIALWVGVISLVLAVPMGIASIMLTPRLLSYLEKRKLIKARKTKEQALQIYNRIRAFREGRRDKYAFYILLGSVAVLCAVAASTIIIVVLLVSPEIIVLWLVTAFMLALMSVFFLVALYETARQLERFDDYKKEFEERWGPLSESDLR
jgi:membrane protein implicated in regulation of membrane protease activity